MNSLHNQYLKVTVGCMSTAGKIRITCCTDSWSVPSEFSLCNLSHLRQHVTPKGGERKFWIYMRNKQFIWMSTTQVTQVVVFVTPTWRFVYQLEEARFVNLCRGWEYDPGNGKAFLSRIRLGLSRLICARLRQYCRDGNRNFLSWKVHSVGLTRAHC